MNINLTIIYLPAQCFVDKIYDVIIPEHHLKHAMSLKHLNPELNIIDDRLAKSHDKFKKESPDSFFFYSYIQPKLK